MLISLDNDDDRLSSAEVVNKTDKGSTGLMAWHLTRSSSSSLVLDKVLGRNCNIWKKIFSELEYMERVWF